MQKVIRNTLLKYIPTSIIVEKVINSKRIIELNSNKINGKHIVYFCEREFRVNDNFSLQFAIQKSRELNLKLKIVFPKIFCDCLQKQIFINRQIQQVSQLLKKLNFDIEIIEFENIIEYLFDIQAGVLIIDFNPILDRKWINNINIQIYEVDGHNIIPARFISNKQEYSATTLRKKIYYNIYPFLTEFENLSVEKVEADYVLDEFLKNKLTYYSEYKNNPIENVTSGLSKYLNLGFISSQRVALEVIKSEVSIDNKEAFLEELIVRKELADNFCLYAKNFKDFSCISNWAKNSLDMHKLDIRRYNYSLEEFENATTHDNLWNSTQNQLKKDGKIHGYLRMYWAKKIFEWSKTPKLALDTAIYLNDKYAYDAPSANGYVGILWALAGLHDRAFKDYFITGKIRRMTHNSIKNKFDIMKYMNKYFILHLFCLCIYNMYQF